MSFRHRQHQGLTLVELLIAMALSLVIMGTVFSIYTRTLKNSADTMGLVRLHQTLESVMAVISNDIRRAGYSALSHASLHTGINSNPFMQGSNQLLIGQAAGEGSASCITYAYDLDSDGRVGVGSASLGAQDDRDNVEQFGFRLKNNAVEMRNGGQNFSCAEARWFDITDSQLIDITQLLFVEQATLLDADGGNGGATIKAREVSIVLAGQLRSDPTQALSLKNTVRVRNDVFAP